MIKHVFFEGSNLTIVDQTGAEKIINVGVNIYKVISTSVHVVLLLSWEELNGTEFHNRNIICLDETGNILWRIINQDTLSISKDKTNYAWSSLKLKNNDCIRVGTTMGMEVDVNIHSGNLLGNWEFTK